jgi:hypothetical protein
MSFKMFARLSTGFAALAAAALAQAASINVLWYGQSAAYNTTMTTLAAGAGTYDPASNGSLDWNLTIWNSSDPTPDFSAYNVLVIGSSQAFTMGFDASRLLAAKTSIEAARGTRTLLSGQDADYHYWFGPGAVDNGPRGFLINAVNWAGSGSGLGIVSLPDGFSGSGSEWWNNPSSFLAAELAGAAAYFQEDDVVIPVSTAGFPVNEGLTTAGLSDWRIASHAGFSSMPTGYISINDAGNRPGSFVTILTESEASGCTTGCGGGTVSTPATPVLLVTALAGLALVRRRRA